MKKASVLLLIIVSLLATSFAGIGVPRAQAATVSVTATPATINTVTALNIIVITTAVSQNIVSLTLPSFQVPSSIPSGITINGVAAIAYSVIPATGQIALWTATPFSTYATIAISTAAGIKTPVSAGTYPITCTVGSDYGSGSVVITGSATPSFTAQLYPTTAGAALQYGYVVFTPAADLAPTQSIVLGFPAGTTFPTTYAVGSITVGGTAVTSTSVSGTQLTLILGAPVTHGVSTTILINSTYGMHNTYLAGTYQLSLTTPTVTIYSNTFQIGGGSVTSPTVQVSPTAPNTAASYTVFFYTSASGGLAGGDTISIQFPSGTTFPSNLNTSVVQVNGVVSPSVSRSSYTVTVMVPYTVTVAAGGWVQVTFPASLGIANPPSVGTYALTINTSKDTTPVQSSQYQITGTSVTGLSLTVDTRAQSAQVGVQVSFQTSAAGTLQQNSGTITVDFPSNMTVPSSINRSLVTVNGTQAHSVSVLSGNVVTIVTPVAIAAYSSVTVVFAGNAGIYNPSTSGVTVTISVSTSADVAPVSTSYTTITSQITQPQVQLTSYGAGSVSGYTISFNTGVAGSLRANYDAISITFPTGTVLPTTINRDLVKVNNYPAYAVTPSGNRLNIIPAVNAAANSPIQVLIDKTANIKNPSVAGSYTLQAYTSVEVTPVSSATYSIANLPRTFIIVSPATADGLAGFYRTRPTVVLTATSSIDPTPVVYYSISGSAQQVYAAPFQLPDGNVTLTYYARDRQGNQEDAQTFTAKVDATAPAITITLPADGTVTGQATIGVQGRTEAGATLTVAGAAVPVSAQGEFQTQVTLRDGQQFIVFTATDVAGNVGQAQLNVTLDTTPPVLTITKPVMFSTVLTSVCEVAGKTEPGATVRIAGAAVSVNADGSFSFNVMLKEGENLIDITATDAVGNQRKTAIPVTYKARTVIHLQVGNKTAMVNDVKKTLQAAPVNVKGVVMVPLRFIGEAFGATVTWDPVFQIIDIELKGSSIRLQLGTNYASVAGKKVILQGIPVSIKGTTMVPIRFIAEAFGAQVIWNAPTQGIDITYPKP